MIKIDVITGFLGAGKTTFMKALMDHNVFEGEKVLIIENEFGDEPIDHMVLDHENYSLIEISGGCICCSLKGDMIKALEAVAVNEKPDRILIEPSGIFIVEDLFEILAYKPIKENFILDGIYTIVDARHFAIDQMRHAQFFRSQLRYASHIIISKINQQENEEVDFVIEGIGEFNLGAEIMALPFEDIELPDYQRLFAMDCKVGDLSVISDDHHTSNHKQMMSIAIKAAKPFSYNEIQAFIKKVIEDAYGEVIRMKGYIEVSGERKLLNYVAGDLELSEIEKGKDRGGFPLTIIGYELKIPELRRQLQSLSMVYKKIVN